MSSWYGMWAGRYVCSRAQKARPSLQLLLKLVTSIFCGQIIKKKEDIRVLKQKKIPANQSQYPIMIMWWKSRGLWWALPERMQLGFENHKEQHENKTFIISSFVDPGALLVSINAWFCFLGAFFGTLSSDLFLRCSPVHCRQHIQGVIKVKCSEEELPVGHCLAQVISRVFLSLCVV